MNIFIIFKDKRDSFYSETLKMANTVSPIIQKLGQDLGKYKNVQLSIGPKDRSLYPKGSALIYKRESTEGMNPSCISGMGNFYYIRLYEWDWEGGKCWYKPLKDIPLNCNSCINEKDIRIPYWNKKLQYAKLGEKYYLDD